MGTVNADGFAEAAREEWATPRQAVIANLVGNHFPPIPSCYAEPVLAAIAAVNEGKRSMDIDITVVEETHMVPRKAREMNDGTLVITAADLLSITHCWSFCDDEGE